MGRTCDDNGQVLFEEEEVRTRWKDYFAVLLESNQDNNAQVPDHRKGQSEGEDVDQETECAEEISVEEVHECIRRLTIRKAPGVCGVTGEMLKIGGEVVVQWLYT